MAFWPFERLFGKKINTENVADSTRNVKVANECDKSNNDALTVNDHNPSKGDEEKQTLCANVIAPKQAKRQPLVKRKVLYIEEVPQDVSAETTGIALEKDKYKALFDSFDDFEPMPAEGILKDADDSKRKFKPDRPKAAEKPKTEKQEIVDIPEDDHLNDDLRIEPEQYETPDDDTPFDIPSRKKVKKEDLPKIRREEMKVELDDDAPEYNYPPIDLLTEGESEDVSKHARRDREKAQLLMDTLESFGIQAKLTGISHGPAFTRFELQPAPGIKISRIMSLSDDIALNLAAMSVRISAPVPGKPVVGIEIPNDKVEMVRLRDVLESPEAKKNRSHIAVGLGKDDSGRCFMSDISRMPHALIAGQTGSGKSMCLHSMIVSMLFRASPDEVRLVLIDTKALELTIYNDIPHLVCPVITDVHKAVPALDWVVAEMAKRYQMFKMKGVRDINGYNRYLDEGEKAMPRMVVIIDELSDLMMSNPGEIENSFCELGQMGSDAGIHVIVSTFRPFAEIFTGAMRNVFPTRIAFATTSEIDSRMILGIPGVERLRGMGDMLYLEKGDDRPKKIWGSYISWEEINAVVEYIKQNDVIQYDPDIISHMEKAMYPDLELFSKEYDPRLPEAIDIVLELGQASISMLQRRMRIGYAQAGRLIDQMAQRGIVSEADGSKPRTVLMTREQINELFEDSY